MEDVSHLTVTVILTVVYVQDLPVVPVLAGLVKDSQNLHKAVVDVPVQQGYLHDNAVVHQAVHKRVGNASRHQPVLIVIGLVQDIQDRLLDVTHTVPQEIDTYHGDAHAALVSLPNDVVGVGILRAQVLAETQCLRLEPGLLQFYEHKLQAAVILAHLRSEVYAEHGYLVAAAIRVLVLAHLHLDDLALEQGRQYCLGHALVLHQVLEHRIINRVGHTDNHNAQVFVNLGCKDRVLSRNGKRHHEKEIQKGGHAHAVRARCPPLSGLFPQVRYFTSTFLPFLI